MQLCVRELKNGILVQLWVSCELNKKTRKGMEYFDTKIKKKTPSWIFLKFSYCKNSYARKQLSYFPISADGKHFFYKFPCGSIILP